LMVNGVDHANDIAADFTYSFEMPDEDVTISATAVEVTASTYTLATSIESGKTYIIVGWAGGVPYAMGEQRTNNRAGVGITVDGTTATVSSEGVYEFVVASLGEDYYSIYDNETPGYLYAAATGSNYLRTETQLDENHNGDWKITINSETGLASVVADQSSNRNVMQFNNSSTIFSCYSSASQHPVYLYVKNEEPVITTITQTIELSEGWNWVSVYIDMSDGNGMAMLEEALGDNAIQIVTEFESADYFGDGEWVGLEGYELSNGEMVLIEAESDCTVTLEGMPADPATVEITLNPGWNWIGFPFATEMDIDAAFAEFEPEDEDMISDTYGSSDYLGEWVGDVMTIVPGQGYFYYNASGDVKTLVFSTGAKKVKNVVKPDVIDIDQQDTK